MKCAGRGVGADWRIAAVEYCRPCMRRYNEPAQCCVPSHPAASPQRPAAQLTRALFLSVRRAKAAALNSYVSPGAAVQVVHAVQGSTWRQACRQGQAQQEAHGLSMGHKAGSVQMQPPACRQPRGSLTRVVGLDSRLQLGPQALRQLASDVLAHLHNATGGRG